MRESYAHVFTAETELAGHLSRSNEVAALPQRSVAVTAWLLHLLFVLQRVRELEAELAQTRHALTAVRSDVGADGGGVGGTKRTAVVYSYYEADAIDRLNLQLFSLT